MMSHTKFVKKDLQHLGDEMYNASFGLEHIFREIGQAFETVSELSSSEVVQKTNHTEPFLTMPRLMASLVVNGMPLELLDGDTAFPLITWIKAVFDDIQKIIGLEKKNLCDLRSRDTEFWEIDIIEYNVWFTVFCECRSMYERSILSADSS